MYIFSEGKILLLMVNFAFQQKILNSKRRRKKE
jgi:hypothetical protein